ncbi:MAG: AAA family ATPase [Candidatus Saccharimonadales bacterium]
MSKGYYIVLEGPEGVGKTTQIELIARQLQKNMVTQSLVQRTR